MESPTRLFFQICSSVSHSAIEFEWHFTLVTIAVYSAVWQCWFKAEFQEFRHFVISEGTLWVESKELHDLSWTWLYFISDRFIALPGIAFGAHERRKAHGAAMPAPPLCCLFTEAFVLCVHIHRIQGLLWLAAGGLGAGIVAAATLLFNMQSFEGSASLSQNYSDKRLPTNCCPQKAYVQWWREWALRWAAYMFC